jgi:hypothetical protein
VAASGVAGEVLEGEAAAVWEEGEVVEVEQEEEAAEAGGAVVEAVVGEGAVAVGGSRPQGQLGNEGGGGGVPTRRACTKGPFRPPAGAKGGCWGRKGPEVRVSR